MTNEKYSGCQVSRSEGVGVVLQAARAAACSGRRRDARCTDAMCAPRCAHALCPPARRDCCCWRSCSPVRPHDPTTPSGPVCVSVSQSNLCCVCAGCAGNPDAKRLYDDLLSNYNKLVRPVLNVSDALTVRIKLKLSQLIDVVSCLCIYHIFNFSHQHKHIPVKINISINKS